jgi:adenylate kinase
MILDRLKEEDCRQGWLLDGFPRNLNQARALDDGLKKADLDLDLIIEIVLDREIAKNRIMGRRLCVNDNNHPNNIFIDAIKPDDDKCRVCGGELKTRADDQDEEAIDKRHAIYYDAQSGTMAAINFYKDLSSKNDGRPKVIELDGRPGVKDVANELLAKLGA